jgi:prepilin-type N-terminal cleavage/methylation domain-containing protein
MRKLAVVSGLPVTGCQIVRNRRGFTLVEALVAVILCGVGVVAAMQALASLQKTNINAVHAERLLRLATNKIEEIGVTSPITETPTDGDFTEDGAPDATYNIDIQVGSVDGTYVVTITATDQVTQQSLSTVLFDATTTSTSGTGTGTQP